MFIKVGYRVGVKVYNLIRRCEYKMKMNMNPP